MNRLDIEIKDVFSGKVHFDKLFEHENQAFIRIPREEFDNAAALFAEKKFILTSLFCEQDFADKGNKEHKGFTLFYVFEKSGHNAFLVVLVDIGSASANSISASSSASSSASANSISSIFPAASWYEREISDGFGILFKDCIDDRRLFLHEIYPKDFHPLLKSFKNRKLYFNNKAHKMQDDYEFKQITGEGVYQIAVGPIHAGIIEPGHFRFSVIGESVYNLEIRMFYLHRGIEKLSEDKAPEDVVRIAESISGDETVANAVAFCNAIEQISGEKIPERAIFIRTILLEMERIYSHLGDIAGMCVDVAYPVGASAFFTLREEILRKNKELTGSRFMKGIVSIGGIKKDVDKKEFSLLNSFLNRFKTRFKDSIKFIYETSPVEDRFETTGVVKHELIKHLNLTGPIARASGVLKDTRQDNAYGLYKKIPISIKSKTAGDVQSRFGVKAEEIIESIRLIQKIISTMPAGDVKRKMALKDGFMISMVEAPRGQSMHYVHLKDGLVQRYKVRTASFCNWQAIEHAILGNVVPDFPLINKSMNLSYAGTDG